MASYYAQNNTHVIHGVKYDRTGRLAIGAYTQLVDAVSGTVLGRTSTNERGEWQFNVLTSGITSGRYVVQFHHSRLLEGLPPQGDWETLDLFAHVPFHPADVINNLSDLQHTVDATTREFTFASALRASKITIKNIGIDPVSITLAAIAVHTNPVLDPVNFVGLSSLVYTVDGASHVLSNPIAVAAGKTTSILLTGDQIENAFKVRLTGNNINGTSLLITVVRHVEIHDFSPGRLRLEEGVEISTGGDQGVLIDETGSYHRNNDGTIVSEYLNTPDADACLVNIGNSGSNADPVWAFRVKDDGTLLAAGWKAEQGRFSADNGGAFLDAVTPAFGLGLVTGYASGIGYWAGKDAGVYKFRVGDPSGQYLRWTGTQLELSGVIVAGSTIGGTASDTFTINTDGTNISPQLIFNRTDADATLTWDGTYFSVDKPFGTYANLLVWNKAGNGWITWATRDVSGAEATYNLSSIGTISSGAITTGGTITLPNSHTIRGDANEVYFSKGLRTATYIDCTAVQHRTNLGVLNKAGSNWVWWALRDTSGAESVMNLSNVGTISSGAITSSGSVTAGSTIIVPPMATNTSGLGVRVGSSYSLWLQTFQTTGGNATILHNAFTARDGSDVGSYKWMTTHASFGSRGIEFMYGAASGIYFYADSVPTTANTAFTPTVRVVIGNDGTVTIGSTKGTGANALYLNALYNGTTQVMDSSRNLSNIGTITTTGLISLGAQATATTHAVRADRTLTITQEASGNLTISNSGTAQDFTANRTWTLGWTGTVALTRGGTGADLSAVGATGGIVYKASGTAFGIMGVGVSGQAIVSGAATAPTWFIPTATRLIFAGTNGALSHSANLVFDDSTKKLTLGTDVDIKSDSSTLTLSPAGNIILDPRSAGAKTVNPNTTYSTTLGQLDKKYLSLYAAELWVETLVAQNTMATIGGRVLVGTTTTLVVDITAVATVIVSKYNNLGLATGTEGSIVYMEANGKIEFMKILAHDAPDTGKIYKTVTGGYEYKVTRNLDGGGADVWNAGDAVFNTGKVGSGFIDIYSINGVKGVSQSGPTIVGNIRNSAAYNDWTEFWAIGNLNGLYGQSNVYGVALGKYSASADSSYVIMDSTYGIRMFRAGAATSTWAPDGTITIGYNAVDKAHVVVTGTGLSLYDTNNKALTSITSGLLVLGETANGRSRIEINSGSISLIWRNTSGVDTTKIGLTALGVATIVGDGSGVTNINGGNIQTGTVTLTQLSFTPVQTSNVVASINTTTEGIRIAGNRITIDGTVSFTAGYDPTGKIASGGAAADVNANATTISGGKITANTVTLTQLNFTPVQTNNVVASINATAEGIRIAGNRITIDGTVSFTSGYDPTTKIGSGGAAADVNANATTISGGKITANTVTLTQLSFTPVQTNNVVASINATAEGIRIAGNRITVDGTVAFTSGYDPTTKIGSGGAAADVNANITTINGGKITANTVTLTQLDFTPVQTTNVVASINATTEGIKISGSKIQIDGTVTFTTGYDPSTKETPAGSQSKADAALTSANSHTDTGLTTKITSGGAAADVNANVTTITGGKITTGTITLSHLNFTPVQTSNVVASINATTEGIKISGNRIQIDGTVTFTTGYDPTTKLKTDLTNAPATILNSNISIGSNGALAGAGGGQVTAAGISAVGVGGAAADVNANVTTITGGKITTGTITLSHLNFTPVQTSNVVASINATTEGIKISGSRIQIDGNVTFTAGYDPTTKETPTGAQAKADAAKTSAISTSNTYTDTGLSGKVAVGGAAADVNANVTTISGGKITTGSISANQLSATAIDGKTITGVTLRTAASGMRIEIDNANEIAFYDSSAYMYVQEYVEEGYGLVINLENYRHDVGNFRIEGTEGYKFEYDTYQGLISVYQDVAYFELNASATYGAMLTLRYTMLPTTANKAIRLEPNGLSFSAGATETFDTNLYRSAAGVLKTDGSLNLVGNVRPKNVAYVWPAALPGTSQVLQCDATGNLAWVTMSGGSNPAYSTITSVPSATILGRNSTGTGNAEAMSVTTVKSMLAYTYSDVGAAWVNHTHSTLYNVLTLEEDQGHIATFWLGVNGTGAVIESDSGNLSFTNASGSACYLPSGGGTLARTSDITASAVGLGNVTNQSKATMFTSPTFTGGITVAKNGTDSTITFPAQTNDPGYIKHYESSNTAIMYFNVSDDANDNFYFGYTSVPGAFILRSDGVVTTGTWQAGVISNTYTAAKCTIADASVITTGNIGSQTVSYATNAGSANGLNSTYSYTIQALTLAASLTVAGSTVITSGRLIQNATWNGSSIGTGYTDAKCTATWPNSYSADQNLNSNSNVTHNQLTLASANFYNTSGSFSFLNGSSAIPGRFAGIQVSTSYSGGIPSNGILFGMTTTLVVDSGNSLKIDTGNGWLQLGPQNTSWCHIYSGLNFYFNHDLYVNGTQVVTNSGTWGINVSGSASGLSGQTYNIADAWFRYLSDASDLRFYGNSRTITYRTDGVTGSGYPHTFQYGASTNILHINTNGDIWMSWGGWMSTLLSNKVDKVSGARPGVAKLYRRDDDSGYNVQTVWDGSYWVLQGYNGDTYHAGARVAYSDYASNSNMVDGYHMNQDVQTSSSPSFQNIYVVSLSIQGQQVLTGGRVCQNLTWNGSSIGTAYTDAKCTATWPNSYSANQNLNTNNSVAFNDLTLDAGANTNYLKIRGASGGGSGNVSIWTRWGNVDQWLAGHHDSNAWKFYSWSAGGDKVSIDHSGNIIAAGNVTSSGSPSDVRLKRNLRPINNALETIKRLQGYRFEWNDLTTDWQLLSNDPERYRHDIGMIAQEVRPYIPEAVFDNQNGYLSLRYDRLVPVLVEAVKTLAHRVEELEREKSRWQ